MKTLIHTLFLAALALLAPALHAAPITWTTTTLSGPTNVSTAGLFVGAMNVGGTTAKTVNGVVFAADAGGAGALPLGSGTTVQFGNLALTFADFIVESNIGASAAYAEALDAARYADFNDGVVTLGGLAVGETYQVQLWIADSRSCCNTRTRTVQSDEAAATSTTSNGPQLATGTFTATATTQTITIAGPGHGPQLNLLQLRDLSTVVTTLDDEDDGPNALIIPGFISLREAVKYSTTGFITFAPGLSGGTITLNHADGDMPIPSAVTIDASALPGGITVSGNNTSRHFVVFPGSSLTLHNLMLIRGSVSDFGGGAILNNGGTLDLFRCTLANNDVKFSGGAILSSGTLRATDCTFSDNTAGELGGAILQIPGTVELTRCTLSGNTAEDGGGIWLQEGVTTTLSHCTVSGNYSAGNASGGGCVASGATLNLLHCTVSQNTGKGGGGIYLQAPAIVHVHSSIIAGNANSSGGPADIGKLSGTLTNSGANLIGSNQSVATEFPPGLPALGSYVGTAAAPQNPKLSPLGYFGGPVQTMHPLIGSLAIDTAGPSDPGGTDARGFPRFEDGSDTLGGRQLDIGAVEAGIILPVTLANDFGGSGTLRTRLANAAIFGDGTRIVFDPAVFPASPITLNFNQLTPPAGKSIFIDASNLSAPVTISAGGNSRVFNIPATATVAMHSVRIVNGLAPSGGPITLLDSSGGGIHNKGTCSVFFSTISGNTANAIGGGIGNLGTCLVHSSTLSGNTSPFGGGGIYNNGNCTVLSSTITGHSVTIGGGIYNERICTVNSSTISGNSATTFGGGLHNNNSTGTFHLSSSIVAGNTAPNSANISNTLATNINNLTSGDPLLSPLGDYGGPTQTLRLLPGSPAREAAGPLNEVQKVKLLSESVSFGLTFNGSTTTTLSESSTPAQVESALAALPSIGAGNVTVGEGMDGPLKFFTVTFTGALRERNQNRLTASINVDVTTLRDGVSGSSRLTDQRGFPRPGLADLGAYETQLGPIANATFKANNSSPALPFTVGQIGTLTATSSNPTLVPNANLSLGGSGANRTLTVTPAANQIGSALITLTDSLSGETQTVTVTVTAYEVTTLDDTATPGSLRQALADAAADPGAGLIVFHPDLSGETLTLGSQIIITDPAGITIDATALSGGLTLSGGNPSRHFTVQPGSSLTLRGLTLTGGSNGPGTVGGSILNLGTLHLFHCVLTKNTSVAGGAILSVGTLECQDSTFSENTATGSGGALYLNSETASAILTRCTFSDNTAPDGGAIMQVGAGPTSFTHCTIAGNRSTAEGSGAGLSVRNGVATLAHCTVSQNLGNNGSGGLLLQAPATVNVVFSLIAGNGDLVGSQPDISILSGTLNGFGVNLIGDNSSVEMQFPVGSPNAQGNYVGTGVTPLNARLSPLASFGGPVQTMHPLIGSPAIDTAGDIVPIGLDVDARGFPRFVDGDASGFEQLDIGAVEAGPLLTVTSNAADGANSLRTRISQGALTLTGARIGFSPSVFPTQTILLDGDTEIFIPVTSGLFIDASNVSAPVTISGNSATRVFNIIQGATVAMHSLKIVNGTAFEGADGGGILNEGTCTVMSCILSGNSAATGGGGAIGNIGACTVVSSTLSGNSADLGGGIYNGDGVNYRITSSTISDNTAGSNGGGIFNAGGGSYHITSSTISGNTATSNGGGIYSTSGSTFMTSSILAGNTAAGFSDFLGSLIGTNNLIGGTPLLAPLGDYGGRTQTMPPLRGSPAIDAGAATTAQTDQRGGSRSRDGDGDFIALPDIGAVEAGLIPVTTTTDSGPGSLRAALTEATTHPGPDTLFFTTIFIIPSVTTDITLASEILINDPAGVTLDASDLPTGVVIDAGPGTNRHFRIAAGTPAVFHRLRLYGGNGTGGGGTTDGGSIHTSGTLTLRECTIADCTTPSAAGAILSDHPGVLTLERCTLYGNFANAGGGAITQLSQNLLTLTACTIAENSARFEAGGINAPFGRPVLLIHCTVTGNAVTVVGANGVGGVRGDGGGVPGVTVRDSIISGNTDANFPGTPDLSAFRTLQGNNVIGGDAKLAPLGDYGGPTFTALPIPGSPAINAATGSTTVFDQRGFARVGTADLGAAEFRGALDVRSYWHADWDGDGQAFGLEHALGTDVLRSDRNNVRNLTSPIIDGLGRPQVTFGVNNAALPGTQWVIRRSTTLLPGSFTEIFRFDGTNFFFNNTQVSVLDNGTTITIIDLVPPFPNAFYLFESLAP